MQLRDSRRTGLFSCSRAVALLIATTVLASWLLLHGCGDVPFDLGVTTGGQQDIASARSSIARGEIPDPASITVEGFLSEHNIPVAEPPDADTLYSTASIAWNKDFDAFTPMATIQIGFGTTIDRDTFRRPPLNLGLVIDRGQSMGDPIDERTGTSKLDAVKVAIDRLLARLDENDRVSVVTFNDQARTPLEGAAGDDIEAVKSAIDDVDARGVTHLVDGLRRGYEIVARNGGGGRADRVILFTDALLDRFNTFLTRPFIGVMEEFAEDEIGATLFGIGRDFGHVIAQDIAQVPGANYFFLSDYERIVSVFDEEFDFLVAPVAYDIKLRVEVPFEFDVVDVYGTGEVAPFPHEIELDIPTLFLTNRHGGSEVFVRTRAGALVEFDRPNLAAQLTVTFTGTDGERRTNPTVEARLPAGLDPDAAESYFESDASRRAVLLLNTALVLRSASEDTFERCLFFCPSASDGVDRAVDRLTEFLPYFDRMAEGLEDRAAPSARALSQERDLVVKLLSNIESLR